MTRVRGLPPIILVTLFVTGCATTSTSSNEAPRRTSVVYLGVAAPPVRIQAGTVRVRHSVPSGARLRATTLVGLDPANRHLSYMWDRDGAYEVAVSGRYEHSVSGSAIGGGAQRLSSTLTYTRLPEGSAQ